MKSAGQLHSEVITNLAREPAVEHADIGVVLFDGGKVRAPDEPLIAEQSAWAAAGVTHVDDHIVLA